MVGSFSGFFVADLFSFLIECDRRGGFVTRGVANKNIFELFNKFQEERTCHQCFDVEVGFD